MCVYGKNREIITRIIDSCAQEHPCRFEACYGKPMAALTTFRAGGPADCWLRPAGGEVRFPESAAGYEQSADGSGEGFPEFTASVLAAARAEGVPVFVLGGGANILVSDLGIRGIVLDTGGWAGETGQGQKGVMRFLAGTSLDAAAEIAAEAGLSGLEFLAGMPGSIGGAVWMNARCYGREIADVLIETDVMRYSGPNLGRLRLPAHTDEFGYKRSPFQSGDFLILSASFRLTHDETRNIRARMDANRADRTAKGHYRFPSAGSVFKNNQSFGKPTGKIIEELGLRGLQKGGAQIAPWHGNIIVNTGSAAASDIRALIDEVAARVKAATGFMLEPEIIFAGEW